LKERLLDYAERIARDVATPVTLRALDGAYAYG
jgi:hypothetical protein